jgi:hypothetical protein
MSLTGPPPPRIPWITRPGNAKTPRTMRPSERITDPIALMSDLNIEASFVDLEAIGIPKPANGKQQGIDAA